MATVGDELMSAVDRSLPDLLEIDEEASLVPLAPGKWCPREVLGHLIDSASNNHQRFVRAQFRDDLVFEGYDQDGWVRAQAYAEVPWANLIELWRAFNRQLAHVMDAVPEETARQPRTKHNLDAIAWQTLPADQPATLAYFMRDYVGHLLHHLGQLKIR